MIGASSKKIVSRSRNIETPSKTSQFEEETFLHTSVLIETRLNYFLVTSRAIFLFGWILGLPGKREFSYQKSRIWYISAHILKEDSRNYRCIWFSKNLKKVDPEMGGGPLNKDSPFPISRSISNGRNHSAGRHNPIEVHR